MSSLLRLMDLGANALQAQNAGVSVASNNAANVNTDGYSRQSVDLRSMRAAPLVGGVAAGRPMRPELEMLSNRQRLSASDLGFQQAYVGALSDLEGALSSPSMDLSAQIADFFGSVVEVGAAPLDPNRREAVVTSARSLATAFRSHSSELTITRDAADERIRDSADRASALTVQIAALNRELGVSDDPVLLDQREKSALELSGLVGGQARVDPDGQMRFVLGNGEVVVDGKNSSSFEAVSDSALGNYSRIDVVSGTLRRDVTSAVEGSIGGEVRFRDVDSVAQLAELDQLASDITSSVNTVHQGYAGLDGVAGRDLFAPIAAVPGAASLMQVEAAVDADPSLLGVADPTAGTGDNTGALALIDLRDQNLAAGGTRTFSDQSIDMEVQLGREIGAASAQMQVARARVEGLEGMRDSLAGVSIQEELARLSQFKYAAEAAAQFISTVDSLLGSLIQTL